MSHNRRITEERKYRLAEKIKAEIAAKPYVPFAMPPCHVPGCPNEGRWEFDQQGWKKPRLYYCDEHVPGEWG